MPSTSHRPGRPSLYPDWSTLVYAFRGTRPGEPRDIVELCQLVRYVAEQGNLCLSFAHLLELLRGRDATERRARAAWLDSLDVVWLLDRDEVLGLELERLLRNAALGRAEQLGFPAAPTLLSTFRGLTPTSLPSVLQRGTVTALVEAVGDDAGTQGRLGGLSAVGQQASERFFVDRSQYEAELGTRRLHAELRAKTDRALLNTALAVSAHLAATDPSYRVRNGLLWTSPGEDFVRRVMRPLDELRHELPSAFVFHEAMRRVGDHVGRKGHLGSSFFRKKARKSDVFDWMHLLGAAYCDVFTCDDYTSECLGDARLLLGRAPQVVFLEGDIAALGKGIRQGLGL
jgi:hypothetical protein